jgi:hypothetical protein
MCVRKSSLRTYPKRGVGANRETSNSRAATDAKNAPKRCDRVQPTSEPHFNPQFDRRFIAKIDAVLSDTLELGNCHYRILMSTTSKRADTVLRYC